MNQKEQQTVDTLLNLVSQLREENKKFREDITTLVTTINTKTEQKHAPLNFETNILDQVQSALNETISNVLKGYNSPLSKLIEIVINNHSDELKKLISDSFSTVIRTDDFKKSIITAFSHKIAKSIISNNDGMFDKVSNELKSDSNFKAKMVLAVSNVVEECLNNR